MKYINLERNIFFKITMILINELVLISTKLQIDLIYTQNKIRPLY